MISPRTVAIYGWITLGILVVLLILVWTNRVDQEMRLPVLIIAGVLVLSRLVLRLLARPTKQGGGRNVPKDSDNGSEGSR